MDKENLLAILKERFGRTFVYHNGTDSYYAARGFRGFVEV
jgi:hypothetical protein